MGVEAGLLFPGVKKQGHFSMRKLSSPGKAGSRKSSKMSLLVISKQGRHSLLERLDVEAYWPNYHFSNLARYSFRKLFLLVESVLGKRLCHSAAGQNPVGEGKSRE